MHEGVGHDEIVAGDDVVAKEQDVEIDLSRRPLLAPGAAHGSFDFQ